MKTPAEKPRLSKWFAETSDWFILFVQTYEERRIAKGLQEALDEEKYRVFVPMKDYAYHKQGKTFIRRVPWINGYVFIATTVSEDECLATIERLTRYDEAVFKMLRNGDRSDSAMLDDHDRAVMRALLDDNFCIPALETVEVGGRLVIADDSPLTGLGGEIIKVDKYKQTATVTIEILGRKVPYVVALAEAYKPKPQAG